MTYFYRFPISGFNHTYDTRHPKTATENKGRIQPILVTSTLWVKRHTQIFTYSEILLNQSEGSRVYRHTKQGQ